MDIKIVKKDVEAFDEPVANDYDIVLTRFEPAVAV